MHINEVLNNFRLGYIRKNSSPTSDKNKGNIYVQFFVCLHSAMDQQLADLYEAEM